MTVSQPQKIVYWSDEDRCYIGKCPSLFYGGVHGANEKRVSAHLDRVVREVQRMDAHSTGRKRTKNTTRSQAGRSSPSVRTRTAALVRRHKRVRRGRKT